MTLGTCAVNLSDNAGSRHARHGAPQCAECKIRSISVCAALDPTELQALTAIARDLSIQPGGEIVEQGQNSDAVWNVTSGTVRLTRILADGRRQIAGFLVAGDFIGLPLSQHYAFSAEAVDNVRLCRFDRVKFEGLLARFPHLTRRLLDTACTDLAYCQEQLVTLARQTADERVAYFLVSLRNRRRALGGEDSCIPLAMTRQDMADHLGLTIETVSRTLSRFRAAGILQVERHQVVVKERGRLERLAQH